MEQGASGHCEVRAAGGVQTAAGQAKLSSAVLVGHKLAREPISSAGGPYAFAASTNVPLEHVLVGERRCVAKRATALRTKAPGLPASCCWHHASAHSFPCHDADPAVYHRGPALICAASSSHGNDRWHLRPSLRSLSHRSNPAPLDPARQAARVSTVNVNAYTSAKRSLIGASAALLTRLSSGGPPRT